MTENTPLDAVKIPGLGRASLEKLAKAGIDTLGRLVTFLPRDYLDYTTISRIDEAPLNAFVRIQGRILSTKQRRIPRRNMHIFELLVDDDFGTIRVLWYNQPWMAEQIHKGERAIFSGKIRFDKLGRAMSSPEFELCDGPGFSGVKPVYRQISGIKSNRISVWIQHAVSLLPQQESLPAHLLEAHHFPSRHEALGVVHNPPDPEAAAACSNHRHPAMRRLIFEEFYHFQLRLQRLGSRSANPNQQISVRGEWCDAVIQALPFQPTMDQMEVLNTLIQQLNNGERLYALIQGDVGCGKTLIGLITAFLFFKAQRQSILLCPTTILAGQHFQVATALLEPLGMKVALATAASPDVARDVDLVVGTHRIFNDHVQLDSLGLVMIDEQHRFGVDQRAAALKKGNNPHYLTFSATPIPRSLALTLYGDFQVMSIRQKPAGRKAGQTILKRAANRNEIVRFARDRIAGGDAVFWVFPLIEDDDEPERAAQNMFQSFRSKHFKDIPIQLVHGRMDRAEINAHMAAFKRGDIKLLVATTVIEVGVDIPHATIMVVEEAQQFGLSQLHQLRGRIGRGDKPAWCFLVLNDKIDRKALERMQFLEKNSDGFQVAEYDLNQRGAGALLGKRQAGKDDFIFGDPWMDASLMSEAAKAAQQNCDEKGCQG